MADKTNNQFKFWEELKRRKVVRVIIGYAASAYVVLELTSIVVGPLRLPEWTINMVLILLIIGFIITAVISWIYDFTPEGIKKTGSAKGKIPPEPVKRRFRASDAVIAVLLIAVIILIYPKVFKRDKFENIRDEDGRISVAVMPFENQTGDTSLDYFQRGISSLLINSLGLSPELSVREDQTMYDFTDDIDLVNTASISPLKAKEVAKKVHAQTYISGSYQIRQGAYFILANLVDAESGDIIWTNRIEGADETGYLDLADNLATEIKNYLEIRAIENDVDFDLRNAYTKSPEAYRYYIDGLNSILASDYTSALESLDNALAIDSNFTFAYFYKAFTYCFKTPQEYQNIVLSTEKAYKLRENLPPKYRNWLSLWYTCYYSKDAEEIYRYCSLLEEAGIESRLFWFDLGVTYSSILQDYEKAVRAFEIIDKTEKESGTPWGYMRYYLEYGKALFKTGNYSKAQEVFESGLNFAATNYWQREMYYNLIIIALSEGKEVDAYMEKYLSLKKEIGQSQDITEYNLGQLYVEANFMAEAEEHARKAYQLNPDRNFLLATTLIEGNINIEEGIELVNKRLEKFPDSHILLYWKAKAFYKLGNYEESLSLVEKAIDINKMYFHDAEILKREVEQALAIQDSKK